MRLAMAAGMMALWLGAGIAPVNAQENNASVKGMWLATDYPALQLRAGEETSLPLTLYNYGLPPQRTALTIAEKPDGWSAEIVGSNKPVNAAFVDFNGKANLNLKLNIPTDAKPGAYKLVLNANGDEAKSSLQIAVDLAAPLAAKLTAAPKFPVLKGTPKSSFDFNVTVKNESSSDMLVNLATDAPRGFQVTFKEGYGTQEITSLPFKPGDSKDIAVAIKPTLSTAAGAYPINVTFNGDKASASARLTMDVSGQPQITLTGQGERLSGEAYAGEERNVQLILRNNGTAPARGVSVASTPPSGWKIEFSPKEIAEIPAGEEKQVTAMLTPPAKAINGDYMLTLRASGDGISESVSYRVTVLTSTLWGVTGIAVIGAALLILVGAVGRFGRR